MEEQRDGSPLCRAVGDGGRTERRTAHPLDPATTRDRDDDEIVEQGSRTRDTTVDDRDGDVEITQQRSPDRRRSCSNSSQRMRQLQVASAATTTRMRSVVTRPAPTLTFGGIGRGAGVLHSDRQLVSPRGYALR